MASAKNTFEPNTFEANTFACGTWRGATLTLVLNVAGGTQRVPPNRPGQVICANKPGQRIATNKPGQLIPRNDDL